MRTINFITHPYTIIISFFAIMISGQHVGGFYLLYILLALPHAGIHSLLALTAVGLLLFVHARYRRSLTTIVSFIFNLIAAFLLFLSLFFFFYTDTDRYNFSTFNQAVPLISLVFFTLFLVSFITVNLKMLIAAVNRSRKSIAN